MESTSTCWQWGNQGAVNDCKGMNDVDLFIDPATSSSRGRVESANGMTTCLRPSHRVYSELRTRRRRLGLDASARALLICDDADQHRNPTYKTLRDLWMKENNAVILGDQVEELAAAFAEGGKHAFIGLEDDACEGTEDQDVEDETGEEPDWLKCFSGCQFYTLNQALAVPAALHIRISDMYACMSAVYCKYTGKS
eukprot:Skav220648  [mRNA]  locus=scaffold2038:188763:197147:- [translate_table: standard]